MKRYEVEYYYYQYNSGMADNGDYTKRILCSNVDEARKIIDNINSAIATRFVKNDIDPIHIESELIPYSGYFTAPPVLFEITENRLT
jgi:hypothetical protein